MSLSEDQVRLLQRAQNLSQQIKLLEERKQLLERRKMEIKEALEELNKAKSKGEKEAYRFLGSSIMVKKDIDEIVADLEEEAMLIDTQVEQLKKQIELGKRELDTILKSLGLQSGRGEVSGG